MTARLLAAVILGNAAAAAAVAPCGEPFVERIPATEARRAKPPGELRSAATLNVAETTNAHSITTAIDDDPRLRNADVLFLQEVLYAEDDPRNVVRATALAMGMHASFASVTEPRSDGARLGLAVLTRAPQDDVLALPLERFDLRVRSRCRLALAVTIRSSGLPVRLIDLHLDTRINAATRLRQLQPALEEARRFNGPVVLAGDFNSTPLWWFEHLIPVPFADDQAEALLSGLAEAGFRTPQEAGGPSTLPVPGLQLRLDWVFLRGLDGGDWGAVPFEPSDHRAVWMDIRLPARASR